MLVLVNEGANGGVGARRWVRVEAELRRRGVAFEARPTSSAAVAAEALDGALARGERLVVAAGGDGTANATLEALLARRDATDGAALGAVGLGSSNDLHKPFREEARVAGVPVRLGPSAPVDVGRALLVEPSGATRTRHFLLNASLGFVADGNAFFNGDDPTLGWLKRRHVEAAIVYTALRNLWACRPFPLEVQLDDEPARRLEAVNVAVLKRVHFAGGMRYDTDVGPADGRFDVNVWGSMRRREVLRTLAGLYRGRFRGRDRTECRRASRVTLTPDAPANLELDGEVTRAARVELSVLPGALRLCAPGVDATAEEGP